MKEIDKATIKAMFVAVLVTPYVLIMLGAIGPKKHWKQVSVAICIAFSWNIAAFLRLPYGGIMSAWLLIAIVVWMLMEATEWRYVDG